ncbi:TAF4 domain-containing protein [Mycena chlorophos]|uniref:Transcription initiation factor TFIID subunit 4 n=1 Tax=Mycena chlorophos TaxID=658473 RepID=A0A8H6TLM3_MYCCL|nr:TAF4 domain-containing protein [Mycena chlorophos]
MSLPGIDLDSLIPLDDNDTTTPVASLPTTPTPVPSASQAAAAAAAYQQYQQYHQYYNGAQAAAVYGTPSPPPQQMQSTSQSQSMARQAITNSAAAATGGGSSSLDTSDVATLNDALGSAGVDLRAEEETLQRSHGAQSSYNNNVFEDRARKQPSRPHFEVAHLSAKMRDIATHHKVVGSGIPEDCVNYLALALKARLQDLVEAMIHAAKYRTSAKFDKPASMYEDGTAAWGLMVRADVAKQLAALEKAEREEEERERELRFRREQALDKAIDAMLAGDDMQVDFPTEEEVWNDRKRRRKAGKSAEVQHQMTNQTANKAAGVPTRTWMTTTMPSKNKPPIPVPPPAATAPHESRPYRATGTAPATRSTDGKLVVSSKDAMFVILKERGHGGGRGAALGWT